MERLVIVLVMVSIVIAALTSVSIALSSMQMMGNSAFSGTGSHHMSYGNATNCNGDETNHMNVTQHMAGSNCGQMKHDQLNMTEHMQNMNEENFTTSHMNSNHDSCHG